MPPTAFQLTDLRGHPCVLILGSSPKDPVSQEQMRQFTDQGATCADHDLILVEALWRGGGAVHHPVATGFRAQSIREADATALHEQFGTGSRFMLVLIDAEGNEVYRDDAPIKLTAICRHLSIPSS